LIVQKALSAVARVHGKFGLTAAAKLLRGAEDPRLHRAGLDQTRTFGILSEYPEEWIVKLLRRSVTAGWVDFHGREHPVVFLTAEGKAAMQGQRRVRLLLPPRSVGSGVRPRGDGRRAAKPAPELDPQGMVMFEALRRHRLERSKTDGVAPYVVASDRTLRDVALLRPRTLEELALAHGIGPAKLERYGAEMLAVVAQAREATMETS
jgi:ATP-dependent DNA helicase RecQ